MIGIVIPVYNEGAVIEKTLAEVEAKVHSLHRVYIVYDFPEDNTIPVVCQWAKTHSADLILVQNCFGRGALNAIKTGFQKAEGDVVLVVMADMSDDLSGVDQMYALTRAGCGVVCGSRYCKGGRQIGGPFFKSLMSRMAGLSLHWLISLPTHDVTNSFKMYQKKLINSLQIESTGGFELGMEITIKAYLQGWRIGEVPSIWFDRAVGESRFRLWAWLPRYIHWYVYGICNFWGKKLFAKV